MNIDLLRTMYAPLDYIHPKRFPKPADDLSPVLQQVINRTLIQRFGLATALDFNLQSSDFSQRLVSDWKNIRRAAWLLGCKLARGNLAFNGQLATLPAAARQFIELPVACPSIPLDSLVDQFSLEMHGSRYVFLLAQHLPTALEQRLRLLFVTEKAPHDCVLNRSLLTFAFDYAKNSIH
jgi:type III secretion system OrgA/MxiK family protein